MPRVRALFLSRRDGLGRCHVGVQASHFDCSLATCVPLNSINPEKFPTMVEVI